MKIITSINAKGGCGKSTLASSVAAALSRRGKRTLLVDMDPQAGLTGWYRLGDGASTQGTITAVMSGLQTLPETIQNTHLPKLDFVASSSELEYLGAKLKDEVGYETTLGQHFGQPDIYQTYDFIVIDSPNQVSPVMHNAIFATDLFLVPFIDPDSVARYPNLFSAIELIRPERDYHQLNVLTGLSNQAGKRKHVLLMLQTMGLEPAKTEVRYCGYLGSVSVEGGSIFEHRARSKGAEDVDLLTDEILMNLDVEAPRIETWPTVPRYGMDEANELPVNPNTQ